MASDQNDDRGRRGRRPAGGDAGDRQTRMVAARGPCSGDSHWRIELVAAHGKIEVGFKVVRGHRR